MDLAIPNSQVGLQQKTIPTSCWKYSSPTPALLSKDPKIVTFPNRAGEVVDCLDFKGLFQDAE